MRIAKRVILFVILIILVLQANAFAAEPKIYSPSVVLIDMNTGKVLYEKDAYKKMYPASVTKIMTAILVLENCELDEIATVSYNAVNSVGFGYVTANLQIGEQLTIDQLLHLLIIASSNDAAIVLAEHVSGSIEDFSDLMNKKAEELRVCKYTFC